VHVNAHEILRIWGVTAQALSMTQVSGSFVNVDVLVDVDGFSNQREAASPAELVDLSMD
jgi:hypothetical protein